MGGTAIDCHGGRALVAGATGPGSLPHALDRQT
jgi:hypothetical protein